MESNKKNELITACENTLLASLDWANKKFENEGSLIKEETILLERIVCSAQQLVERGYSEF